MCHYRCEMSSLRGCCQNAIRKVWRGAYRHVLAEDTTLIESDLEGRIFGADVNLMHALNASMYRGAKNSVSGLLLCYAQIPEISSENKRPFRSKSQDFTSEHVKEGIRKKLRAIPVVEKAELVLKHLNHEKVDRSGVCLEGVTAKLLSFGSKVKWVQSPPISANDSEEVIWKKAFNSDSQHRELGQ
jgi:hypothetical protein